MSQQYALAAYEAPSEHTHVLVGRLLNRPRRSPLDGLLDTSNVIELPYEHTSWSTMFLGG